MLLLSAVCLLGSVAAAPPPLNSTDPELQRGRYLTLIAGCHACHTEHAHDGAFLAGGAAIRTPFGEFFPPNITPDRDTGIGGWTEADFVNAMQHGIAPDGRPYFPVFPYTSYSRMQREDIRAIKQYLDQIPAVRQPRRSQQPSGLARAESLLALWQALNLKPDWSTREDRGQQRGAYLVEAVSHCGECHSRRDALGATRYRFWLRGARLPSGHWASNLTPHPDGIAAWERDELAEYLRRGRSELGAKARYEMREFVDHAGRYLTEPDSQAIADYLMALPAGADHERCRWRGPRPSRCRASGF
jgi:mono/diheme cytochrome c family protein